MDLLNEKLTRCVRLIARDATASDGMGGTAPAWSEGEVFQAALVYEDTRAGRSAEKDVGVDTFTVITPRTVCLKFHDVFRRASDGAVFRVISNGDDRMTPPSAGLDMRAARAERWAMT